MASKSATKNPVKPMKLKDLPGNVKGGATGGAGAGKSPLIIC